MQRNPLISVKQSPNNNMRVFHFYERTPSGKLIDAVPGIDYRLVTDCKSETKVTAMSFYDIDGVVGVGLEIHEVKIVIAPAFKWEVVQPQVVDLIKKHLR